MSDKERSMAMAEPFSPEKLGRMQDLIARLANEFGTPTLGSGPVSTTAKRRSQIAQDLNFNLNVRVAAEAGPRADEPSAARCVPRSASGSVSDPLLMVTPEELSKIRSIDKQVLEWIAASPSNAALFIAEPVRAIESSGVAIDRTLLKKIGSARNTQPASGSLPPGVRIARLKVEAKPATPISRDQNLSRASTLPDPKLSTDQGGKK
jgi:hypothetical protein